MPNAGGMPALGSMINGPGTGVMPNGDFVTGGTVPMNQWGAAGVGGGGAFGVNAQDWHDDGRQLNRGMDGVQATGLGTGWKQTGGLSLDMILPTSGQKLVFGKSGGDAKLALVLRPRRALSLSLGLVWMVFCVALAAVCVLSGRSARLRRMVPMFIAGLAAIGVIVLAGPLSGLAFVVFLVAAATTAWTYRNAPAV